MNLAAIPYIIFRLPIILAAVIVNHLTAIVACFYWNPISWKHIQDIKIKKLEVKFT